MRVLHVIPAIAARYGGPSSAVLGLTRALAESGVETLIATTDADGGERLPLPLGEITEYEGAFVIAFRRVATESFKYTPGLSAWLNREVANFDVVHIHGVMSHSSLAASWAARASNVPYVLRPLGALDDVSLGHHPRRKQAFLRLWGRSMVKDAAVVHCTGPEEFATVRDRYAGSHPVLLPLGIDDRLFTSGSRREVQPPYVLCMSRLAERKGIEDLVDAFGAVAGEGTFAHWRLVLAGSGNPAFVARLAERAGASQAADRIELPGWVAGAAKQEWLSGAAVFALPSLHENFGLSVLEAMACGAPVIIRREVQIAHWVALADAGWITDGESGSLEAALREAMSKETERERRGTAARDVAMGFRWPVIAEHVKALYQQVIRPRSRSPVAAASVS